MNRSSRSRLVRALILFVAMVLVGGAAVDAYVWHRDSTRPRTVAVSPPVAIPVVTPTPTTSAPPPIHGQEQVAVDEPRRHAVADVFGRDHDIYPRPIGIDSSTDLDFQRAPQHRLPAAGKKSVIAQRARITLDASVPGWYEVQVPVRPNGSQGWVQASDVTIREVPDYLRVYQSQFRLEYFVGGQLKKSFTVAVGAPSTPTPFGHFYVWASEAYGGEYSPGIFALSAFSPVLENWPGGGRTGIHGWTDTSVMGKRASHGCVRMAPADFAQLLQAVPLGTPVDLLA